MFRGRSAERLSILGAIGLLNDAFFGLNGAAIALGKTKGAWSRSPLPSRVLLSASPSALSLQPLAGFFWWLHATCPAGLSLLSSRQANTCMC